MNKQSNIFHYHIPKIDIIYQENYKTQTLIIMIIISNLL